MENKKNICDIILDLLPLYADEICSEQSKNLVEEHIAECADCRKAAEICKKSAFTAKSLEKHQLNAMKKVNRRLKIQKVLIILFLSIIAIMGLFLFLDWNPLYSRYYIPLFLLALFCFGWLTFQKNDYGKPSAKDLVSAAVSVMLSIIVSALYWYFTAFPKKFLGMIEKNNIQPFHVGPMINYFQFAMFFLQFLILVYSMKRFFKNHVDTRIGCILAITGIFLQFSLNTILYYMDVPETLNGEARGIILSISAIGLCACLIQLFIMFPQKKGTNQSPRSI